MNTPTQPDVTPHIIEKAKSFGASLAGIAEMDALKTSPSHNMYSRFEWPAEAKSALVLALAHQESEPALDWWGVKGGTAENRSLQNISTALKQDLQETYDIKAQPWPYSVEMGGIFLKDAAVLAGLGIIGLNNLLITPEFGSRVRLRALSLDTELAPTGPIDFSPCDTCGRPCQQACPQQAFASGAFSDSACSTQMQVDEANKVVTQAENEDFPIAYIKYCRACELACPIGK
ncbi:epoxyqueuosine reductase [Chloroflexota bacterium]